MQIEIRKVICQEMINLLTLFLNEDKSDTKKLSEHIKHCETCRDGLTKFYKDNMMQFAMLMTMK